MENQLKITGRNILSLFDGISCLRQALDRAGVSYGQYFASEIDNAAIQVAMYHYPDTIQLGDVRGIITSTLPEIWLLAGGSPCKDFAVCGRRKGMSIDEIIIIDSLEKYLKYKSDKDWKIFDNSSTLFWEFVRILKEVKPTYFLLENVDKMPKGSVEIISRALGVTPIRINSKVASAQSRPRQYWTNIPYTEIKDMGILLGDVVLGAVTGTGKHGKKIPEDLQIPNGTKWKAGDFEDNGDHKSYCITTRGGRYKNLMGEVKIFTAEDCEGLQTLKKGYTGVTGLCKTKRNKLTGNGWTVDVLVYAFFKNLPSARKLKAPARWRNFHL